MEKLQLVVALAVGLLAGAVVALKAIAPKTKTLADDKVLEKLMALEALIERMFPGHAPALEAAKRAEEDKPA